jgi:hypothetical protein
MFAFSKYYVWFKIIASIYLENLGFSVNILGQNLKIQIEIKLLHLIEHVLFELDSGFV